MVYRQAGYELLETINKEKVWMNISKIITGFCRSEFHSGNSRPETLLKLRKYLEGQNLELNFSHLFVIVNTEYANIGKDLLEDKQAYDNWLATGRSKHYFEKKE